MSVLVKDEGFAVDDCAEVAFLPLDAVLSGAEAADQRLAVDFPNDRDPAELAPLLDRVAMVRVAFPAMGDGRGLSIARRLRAMAIAGGSGPRGR